MTNLVIPGMFEHILLEEKHFGRSLPAPRVNRNAQPRSEGDI
jgi:hypothetical protein